MVAASGSIRIEVAALHTMIDQVLTSGAIFGDAASRRNVVGSDRIVDHYQHASLMNILERCQLGRDLLEEGWLLNVGRVRIPGEEVAGRVRERAPMLIV